jgi:pimeloyl-ACP methyl ester carboxylesterase
MTDPRLDFVPCLDTQGLHRMAYWEWGDRDNPRVVVCVHGLTRQGRDFDTLARALAADYRVICPDVAGRGRSDWLADPMGYQVPAYVSDMVALLARVGAPQVDWVGTSMGGLIGMLLAARPGSPIRRLVLNDVGALVPWTALFRMKGYITRGRSFETLEEVEAYFRDVCATFGPLTDAQWQHLARHGARRNDEGGYELRYDPKIGDGLHGHVDPEFPLGPDLLRGIDLWSVWSKLELPTLVLRGADSDVLQPSTVEEMKNRKPDTEVVEFPGVGHAPALMSKDQIRAVKEFLLRD